MLFETYAELVNSFPEGCDQLFGQPITDDNSLWLSVDGDSYPSLLFKARRDDARNDIELRSVSAHFSRSCEIDSASGARSAGIYTVVRLNENDPDITRMLLRLLEEAFRERRTPYSNKDIASRILELADLFKLIGESIGDILGLWGELYILSQSSNLELAAQSWCQSKNAKYDFVTDHFALEAKTTMLSRRKHRFSLDQLRPNGDFQVYVASLLVVEISSGRTAAELMEEVYRQLSDSDLRANFFNQCIVKGGRDLYRNELKLGVFPDQSSLKIHYAAVLPVPDVAVAAPIENVRFDVDLTDLEPVSQNETMSILSFGAA